MKILAVSGSVRRLSTNTALLRAMQTIAPHGITINIFDGIGDLPIFSPDLEDSNLPNSVRSLTQMISDCDGLLICSPEYVRGIPGGLKNAIDWLVSGDQIVGKPVALAHASHRGIDMLAALRTVLSTISSNFNENLFYQLPAMKETPESIGELLKIPANRQMVKSFSGTFPRIVKIKGPALRALLPSKLGADCAFAAILGIRGAKRDPSS